MISGNEIDERIEEKLEESHRRNPKRMRTVDSDRRLDLTRGGRVGFISRDALIRIWRSGS